MSSRVKRCLNEKENSFEKCEIIFSNSGGAFRFPDSVAIELIKMPEEQKQRRRRVVHIKLFQEGMKQKKDIGGTWRRRQQWPIL